MGILEILLLGIALAMDACAIAMTNGMTEREMPLRKTLTIGGFFGVFQWLMPLIGYFITGLVASVFVETFEKISAWVSFILLAFLGGKMLYESIRELREIKTGEGKAHKEDALTLGRLFVQAVATSIDALAVGVTLQMAALSEKGLFGGVWGSTLLIGGVTFVLSVAAVYVGKAVGNKLADKAGFLGGIVLIAIGLKLLIEGMV